MSLIKNLLLSKGWQFFIPGVLRERLLPPISQKDGGLKSFGQDGNQHEYLLFKCVIG